MLKYVITTFKTKDLKFIIAIIFMAMMVLMLALKANLYIDETCSYSFSNNTGSGTISFQDGITYSPSSDIFLKCFTVSKSQRFDYTNVWINQANDVHPPLYHVILHTICSVFPETFSIWYAGIINIVFSLLTFFVIQKLFTLLSTDQLTTNILLFAYIFSSGILFPTIFLRMYVMAMFWVTLLAYLLTNEIDKDSNWTFYIAVFTVTVLSALTHYYCIIYAVLISIIYTIYLLAHKKWKNICLFCCSMFSAGIISYFIFPAMVRHMFSGGRGTEAFNNFFNISDYQKRITTFFSLINGQLFGNILGCLLVFFLSSLFFILVLRKPRNINQNIINLTIVTKYLILAVPSAIFFLIVSKIAAYQIERYMSPIYAITFSCVFCFIFNFSNQLFSNQIIKSKQFYIIMCIILAFTTLNSWRHHGWTYWARDSISLIEKAADYKDVSCICIYNAAFETQTSFMEISQYNDVTFVSKNNMQILSTLDNSSCQELVVIVIDENEDDEIFYINDVLSKYPLLNQYEEFGQYSYGTSYYLYK